MTTHCMIDLETLSTAPTAAIVAIGAVRFDPEAGAITERLTLPVCAQSSIDAGLTVDADTLVWWMRQDAAVRGQVRTIADAARRGVPEPLRLDDALGRLAAFASDAEALWCNWAAFDFAVLAHAYRACGLPRPWDFRKERCYGTLRKLRNLGHEVAYPDRPGQAHCAIEDATAQAEHLIAILARIASLRAAP